MSCKTINLKSKPGGKAGTDQEKPTKKQKRVQESPVHLEDDESYPLPPDLQAADAAAFEPLEAPWPAKALLFKCWPERIGGERDVMLCDILKERGWADGGSPCDESDVNELPKALAGKDPRFPLPRRALWISSDQAESKRLHAAFSVGGAYAGRYRVTSLPATSASCHKTYTATSMAEEPFAPTTFVLPAQRAEFLIADKALRASGKAKAKGGSSSSVVDGEAVLWVGKPKYSYAGKGIVVSSSASALADGKGVVQRYVHRPLLVGGYKFHMVQCSSTRTRLVARHTLHGRC